MTQTHGGIRPEDGQRNRPDLGGHPAQSAALPPDVFDAITDALADALTAEIIAELLENSTDSRPMVGSPSGVDHAA